MLPHQNTVCVANSEAQNHNFWQFWAISGTFGKQVIEYEPDLDDTNLGQLISEIAMSASLMWASLLIGNFALLMLWVHYIVKVLKGQCPHCGK
jgi:hypothetical protein